MGKRILIITPKFPYPATGACEQDRAAGIESLLAQGHELFVITKIYNNTYQDVVNEVSRRLHIPVIGIPYKRLHSRTTWKQFFWRLLRPAYFDGSAFEYADPEMRAVVKKTADEFRPDIVWFDYTYLWPLYRIFRKKHIPIITRSINFEPIHFLEEDGRSAIHYVQFVFKCVSELLISWYSDIVFAITPQEARLYRRMGAKRVDVLPLRGLPRFLAFQPVVEKRSVLNVFFFGSTYHVTHNRLALEFLLTRVVPEVQKKYPGEFIFHILGGKIPTDLEALCVNGVTYHGYVPDTDVDSLLQTMDIALIPSLYGAGMQQKIFEPLARGIPVVTSMRGMAGYPFIHGTHLFLAKTVDDFVNALGVLRNIETRRAMSHAAKARALEIFSRESIEGVVSRAVNMVVS